MKDEKPARRLQAAVVGCRMGRAHARSIASLEEYDLVAVCDIVRDAAAACAGDNGIDAIYTNYAEMLAQVKPDVVAVATPTNLHPEHTLQALDAGAKGICSEKPMAVCMGDARSMVEKCKSAGVPLVINHQRRLGYEMVYARQLIQEGTLGEIRMIRGECAGDILSDGTHLIDSIMWLAGDEGAEWVLGQIHRDLPKESPPGRTPGHRYGHTIETGAMAVIRLKNGLRAEIVCGDLRTEGLAYQDYQVIGSKGILWRCGDRAAENLFICDDKGGGWIPGLDNGTYKPISAPDGKSGMWRPVEIPVPRVNPIAESYRLLAASIREGAPHPLSGENALVGFEMLMAIFESARLHKRIRLPLEQDRYPLDIMIEQGIL
jgi:UDP-N-acetyl-2-amino-2-deoxyglucuronate dehydrogenase